MTAMKFVVFLVLATPLLAQYPGSYPPGQYPPGTMGGGGISLPSWAHKKKKKDAAAATTPDFTADGKAVSNDGKKLVIATADGRTMNFALTDKTKFTKDGNAIAAKQIVEGTTVHVEASEDDQSNLTAMTVQFVKAVTVEERPTVTARSSDPTLSTQPSKTEAKTTEAKAAPVPPVQTANDDDQPSRPPLGSEPVDPDRPALRRGKPKNPDAENAEASADTSRKPVQTASARKPSAVEAPETQKSAGADFTIDDSSSAARKTTSKPGSDLIAKATDWSQNFTHGLPNYVCEQNTTRYMQQSKAEGWQALDLVTAKVIYEDGKEKYQEITVGGHKTNKSMLELGGSTSVGEFGSTLQSIFSSYTNAEFKFAESTSLQGEPAAIYDFSVALNHSDWTIQVGGQQLRPAYSGSIWIEKKTGQVRRIEMSANKIPQDFPLDHVEWTVDYDSVSLGTAKFLLPTHAENLSCQRGSNICVKNGTDFRNYHRYTGESTVTFQ